MSDNGSNRTVEVSGIGCVTVLLCLILLGVWSIADYAKKILDRLPEPPAKQEAKP